jgi:hypothetical protein
MHTNPFSTNSSDALFKASYWVCTVSFSSVNLLIDSVISSKDTMEVKQRCSPVTSSRHHKLVVPVVVQNTTVD